MTSYLRGETIFPFNGFITVVAKPSLTVNKTETTMTAASLIGSSWCVLHTCGGGAADMLNANGPLPLAVQIEFVDGGQLNIYSPDNFLPVFIAKQPTMRIRLCAAQPAGYTSLDTFVEIEVHGDFTIKIRNTVEVYRPRFDALGNPMPFTSFGPVSISNYEAEWIEIGKDTDLQWNVDIAMQVGVFNARTNMLHQRSTDQSLSVTSYEYSALCDTVSSFMTHGPHVVTAHTLLIDQQNKSAKITSQELMEKFLTFLTLENITSLFTPINVNWEADNVTAHFVNFFVSLLSDVVEEEPLPLAPPADKIVVINHRTPRLALSDLLLVRNVFTKMNESGKTLPEVANFKRIVVFNVPDTHEEYDSALREYVNNENLATGDCIYVGVDSAKKIYSAKGSHCTGYVDMLYTTLCKKESNVRPDDLCIDEGVNSVIYKTAIIVPFSTSASSSECKMWASDGTELELIAEIYTHVDVTVDQVQNALAYWKKIKIDDRKRFSEWVTESSVAREILKIVDDDIVSMHISKTIVRQIKLDPASLDYKQPEPVAYVVGGDGLHPQRMDKAKLSNLSDNVVSSVAIMLFDEVGKVFVGKEPLRNGEGGGGPQQVGPLTLPIGDREDSEDDFLCAQRVLEVKANIKAELGEFTYASFSDGGQAVFLFKDDDDVEHLTKVIKVSIVHSEASQSEYGAYYNILENPRFIPVSDAISLGSEKSVHDSISWLAAITMEATLSKTEHKPAPSVTELSDDASEKSIEVSNHSEVSNKKKPKVKNSVKKLIEQANKKFYDQKVGLSFKDNQLYFGEDIPKDARKIILRKSKKKDGGDMGNTLTIEMSGQKFAMKIANVKGKPGKLVVSVMSEASWNGSTPTGVNVAIRKHYKDADESHLSKLSSIHIVYPEGLLPSEDFAQVIGQLVFNFLACKLEIGLLDEGKSLQTILSEWSPELSYEMIMLTM